MNHSDANARADWIMLISNYLWIVVSPILLFVGTLGNCLSILVLSRRNLRGSQASLYLIALSITDIVVLYTGLLRQFLRHATDKDVRYVSEFGCKLHLMMVYSSLDISVWILVAFTFERILSVYMPHRIRSYCTRLASCIVIVLIIFIFLSLNSHFFFGMGKVRFARGNRTFHFPCASLSNEYDVFINTAWPWIDFSVFNLIPSLVFIFGNTCIALKVLSSRRKAKRVGPYDSSVNQNPVIIVGNRSLRRTENSNGLAVVDGSVRDSSHERGTTSTGGRGNGAGIAAVGPVIGGGGGGAVGGRGGLTVRQNKTSSMTAILVLLNFLFLVTTTPVSVFFIVQASWTQTAKSPLDYAIITLTFSLVNLIMYMNNATNFILYCITGSRFRKELKCMFVQKNNRVHPEPNEEMANRDRHRAVMHQQTSSTLAPPVQDECVETRI